MFQRMLCVLLTVGIVVSWDGDATNGQWAVTFGLLVILGWLVIDDKWEW